MRRNKTPFWFYPVFSLGPWLWPKFSPWNGNSTLQFPLGPWDRWPKQGLHVSLLFEGTSRANSRGEQVEQHRRRSLNFDLEPERHGPMGRRRNGVEKHFVSGSKSIFFLVKTYKTRVHKVNWSKNPRILCEFDNEQTFSIKKPKSAFHSGPFLWVGGVSGWGGGEFSLKSKEKPSGFCVWKSEKKKAATRGGSEVNRLIYRRFFFAFPAPFFSIIPLRFFSFFAVAFEFPLPFFLPPFRAISLKFGCFFFAIHWAPTLSDVERKTHIPRANMRVEGRNGQPPKSGQSRVKTKDDRQRHSSAARGRFPHSKGNI